MAQGITDAQPLKIRILLEQREVTHPLSLRATNLNINGQSQQGSELRCSATGAGWVCIGGGNAKKPKKFVGKIRVGSDEGFIRIGKSFYRDTIVLAPAKSKLNVINELDVESYLVGLVNSEISSKYPREAIKAQVIAARSYALACMRERKGRASDYDLDSTEVDQAYRGAQVEDAMSHFAVRETRGKVLLSQGKIVKAFYHASSGGTLERPESVWGKKRGSQDSVYSLVSPREADDDNYKWKISFGSWIGLKIPGLGLLRGMEILERSAGDRVQKVLLIGDGNSKIVRGSDLRKLFGGRWLKSTLFNIEQNGARWTLEGRGFGHGVGLSQLGAKTLAEKGWSYKKILAAYYPGAQVSGASGAPTIAGRITVAPPTSLDSPRHVIDERGENIDPIAINAR